MKNIRNIFDLVLCVISLLICVIMLATNIKEVIADSANPLGAYLFGFLCITSTYHVVVRAKDLRKDK